VKQQAFAVEVTAVTDFCLPGPAGLSLQSDTVDDGTLCRMASPRPGPLGFPVLAAPLSGLPLEALARARKAVEVDVDAYLRALGKPGAPPLVRARVQTAAAFFETRFRGKQFTEVTEYLKGIDFSQEVRQVKLVAEAPWQSTLVQYVAGDRPGNFFSKSGNPADRLGIALGVRRLQRFRVTNAGVDVLVCTAAPVSDTWTPGRTRHVRSPVQARLPGQAAQRAGELTAGGGLQIIVPDPVSAYLEPVSANW